MSNLDATQLAQLKEIGTQLRDIRQRQSRSLEEVSAKTYIPVRLLRAIEDGRGDILPEPVFIQGFIRRYADLLELNGMALSKEFSIVTTPPMTSEEKLPAPGPKVSTPPPKEVEPRKEMGTAPKVLSQPAAKESPQPALKPGSRPNASAYAVYAIVGLVVVGGIWLLANRNTSQTQPSATQPQLTADPTTGESSPSPVASAPAPVSPTPTPSPSPTPTAPVEVRMNLVGRSWMRVTTDGRVEFEGVLEQGTQRTWTAQQDLRIRVGDAGAVEASINGGTAQVMGTPGQPQTFTFTPESTPSPTPPVQ